MYEAMLLYLSSNVPWAILHFFELVELCRQLWAVLVWPWDQKISRNSSYLLILDRLAGLKECFCNNLRAKVKPLPSHSTCLPQTLRSFSWLGCLQKLLQCIHMGYNCNGAIFSVYICNRPCLQMYVVD